MVFPTLVSVGWFGLGLVVAGCGELFCFGMGLLVIRVSCVSLSLIVLLGCWLGFLSLQGSVGMICVWRGDIYWW